MSRKKILLVASCSAMALLVFACARDYVTGKRTFNLVSESQEIEIGRESDPQIIAEFGLYDDTQLASYVDAVGQKLARKSQRPSLQYTFRVVDSPVVNAFALPGGFVYMTRGILAHFNSEAELAGVMGHEIGHVVARHGAEQMSKAQLAQVGLGVGSALSEKFARYSNLAQTGLGLLFLSFSRSQESEADLLGVEYSTALGYNAHEMARFFNTIARISAQSGQKVPNFLSTHPDPGGREVRVNQLADEWQHKVPYTPLNLDPQDYLRRIDGLVYGEDPRQGFVENNMFYHPALRFQFPAPKGWKLINSPSSIQIISAKQDAVIEFSLGKGSTAAREAGDFITKAQATGVHQQNIRVHNFPAVALESTLQAQEQLLHILSYFIEKGGKVFVFHSYTTDGLFATYASTFGGVMQGFDELRNQAALNKKPSRVRVVAAPQSGDFASVLKALNVKPEMMDELAILNSKKREDKIERGELVKVVRQ